MAGPARETRVASAVAGPLSRARRTPPSRPGGSMPTDSLRPAAQSPRPAALVRRVVFVDGVRTPFGRARKDGLYAHTRADDLSVKTVRELLRRHPELPPE